MDFFPLPELKISTNEESTLNEESILNHFKEKEIPELLENIKLFLLEAKKYIRDEPECQKAITINKAKACAYIHSAIIIATEHEIFGKIDKCNIRSLSDSLSSDKYNPIFS